MTSTLNSFFRNGLTLLIGIGIGIGMAVAAQAQTPEAANPALGQQIASGLCAGCHGADGNSVININPKLAGQHADYLVKQLIDFSKGAQDKDARASAIMAGFSAALSETDRRHVAAWYASQKPTPGLAKNKDTLELGKQVYRGGIAQKSVPACSGCHSPNGAGIPSQYPRLSGQHAAYTEAQLKAFRDGTRQNSLVMTEVAQRLSDQEMAAVADYIAGLR